MDEVLHDWPARSKRSGLVQRRRIARRFVPVLVSVLSLAGLVAVNSSSASESPNVPPTLSSPVPAVQQVLAPAAAAASAEKVLILASTVVGGALSMEATEAVEKGFTVDLVDAATLDTHVIKYVLFGPGGPQAGSDRRLGQVRSNGCTVRAGRLVVLETDQLDEIRLKPSLVDSAVSVLMALGGSVEPASRHHVRRVQERAGMFAYLAGAQTTNLSWSDAFRANATRQPEARLT